SWSISDMQAGFYNIVYRGGDVGIRIETNVEVPGNPRGLMVNPKLTLPSIVTDPNLVVQDQTIEVSGNITITDATSLTFSGTNYLLFTTGSSRLTVEAEVNFQTNTTLSGIRLAGTGIPRLIFIGQNNFGIRGLRAIDDMRVQVNGASLSFADCVFKGGTSAGLELTASTISVSRSLVSSSIEGISLMQMSSFNCDNSVFYNNNTAILASIVGQGVIEKNTFLVMNEGIECGSSNGNTIFEIRNNVFRGGDQQVLLGPNSIMQIRQNEFYDANKNIHLEPVSHPVPSIDVVINQNSFFNTSSFALELENTTALDTVDALSNYWGTVDISEINNLIFDRNDRPNETSIRFVNYTPFATEPVQGAGIGGN
ncbi:MAG: right-handed parallel beta-helix repeat-containing protein, partial [Calditrichota bacterium]